METNQESSTLFNVALLSTTKNRLKITINRKDFANDISICFERFDSAWKRRKKSLIKISKIEIKRRIIKWKIVNLIGSKRVKIIKNIAPLANDIGVMNRR